MKNNILTIPIIFTISILLGLLTYVQAMKHLANAVIEPEVKNATKTYIGKDSVYVSSRLNDISEITIGEAKKKLYFNLFPASLMWIVFHSCCLSIGVVFTLFLIYLIGKMVIHFEIDYWSSKTILPVFLMFLIIAIFAWNMFISSYEVANLVTGQEIMNHFKIVFTDSKKVTLNVTYKFFFMGIVALLGVTIVNIITSNILADKNRLGKDVSADYKSLRDNLNVFALFSGLLVVVPIIGIKLQRDMIVEQLEGAALIFPDEFIYAYGLSFTLILALFFLPSLSYLKYMKKEKFLNLEKEDSGWWKIGAESIEDMKIIFAIALPFISSLLQPFIE